MNGLKFQFAGSTLHALPSGALFLPTHNALCVSDLHLGKAGRRARSGGAALPPYEVTDTLTRLEADLTITQARRVICLGDSFDDMAAAQHLPDVEQDWILRMMAGRDWIWIEGNHDPAPLNLGGRHARDLRLGDLTLRHIAKPGAWGEISGHYHPKLTLSHRGRSITRRCFLIDSQRLILPAFGTYTGGLRSTHPALAALMSDTAEAIILTDPPVRVPLPKDQRNPAASTL